MIDILSMSGEFQILKESKEDKLDDLYKEWQKLINMSSNEIQKFLDSDEGKEAGLSQKEAKGKIKRGRDSGRAIIRMLGRKKSEWTDNDWEWAKRQVNFINRMLGNKGKLRDEKGNRTRKTTSLMIWGHNPEK